VSKARPGRFGGRNRERLHGASDGCAWRNERARYARAGRQSLSGPYPNGREGIPLSDRERAEGFPLLLVPVSTPENPLRAFEVFAVSLWARNDGEIPFT